MVTLPRAIATDASLIAWNRVSPDPNQWLTPSTRIGGSSLSTIDEDCDGTTGRHVDRQVGHCCHHRIDCRTENEVGHKTSR
jgi:hypothetical protein